MSLKALSELPKLPKSMGKRFVLISPEPVRYLREDGGYTLRYHIADPKIDRAFNIVLQSHEEQDRRLKPTHAKAREFAGKRVRITIEEIE